jgi:hypothetical protein
MCCSFLWSFILIWCIYIILKSLSHHWWWHWHSWQISGMCCIVFLAVYLCSGEHTASIFRSEVRRVLTLAVLWLTSSLGSCWHGVKPFVCSWPYLMEWVTLAFSPLWHLLNVERETRQTGVQCASHSEGDTKPWFPHDDTMHWSHNGDDTVVSFWQFLDPLWAAVYLAMSFALLMI